MINFIAKLLGKKSSKKKKAANQTTVHIDEFSSYLYHYTPEQKMNTVKDIVSKSSQDQRDLVEHYNKTYQY